MKPTKPESPKTPDTHNPAPAMPPASPLADASTKTNNAAPPAPPETANTRPNGKPGKPKITADGTRIISVAIPERLARQVKLVCSVTGQTAQSLVEAALQKAVNRQLAAALESIKPDVDG